MAFFLLLPGAGGASFYWRDVVRRLEAAGHEALAVDFPADDPKAGLPEYAAIAASAARGRTNVVLAAQSMGGFTAARVAERIAVKSIVLVNAMIPVPGEKGNAWGKSTGSNEARRARAKAHGYGTEVDLDTYFLHDVSPDVAREMKEHDRDETELSFEQPCEFEAWPSVPIHVLIGADDRLFPSDFQERVARERLGTSATTIETIRGGHLVGMSEPALVAEKLLAYAAADLG